MNAVELNQLLEVDGAGLHLPPPVLVHPRHGQPEFFRHLLELAVEELLDEIVRAGVIEPDGRDQDDLGLRVLADPGHHLLDIAAEELRRVAAEGVVEGELDKDAVRLVEVDIRIDPVEPPRGRVAVRKTALFQFRGVAFEKNLGIDRKLNRQESTRQVIWHCTQPFSKISFQPKQNAL